MPTVGDCPWRPYFEMRIITTIACVPSTVTSSNTPISGKNCVAMGWLWELERSQSVLKAFAMQKTGRFSLGQRLITSQTRSSEMALFPTHPQKQKKYIKWHSSELFSGHIRLRGSPKGRQMVRKWRIIDTRKINVLAITYFIIKFDIVL